MTFELMGFETIKRSVSVGGTQTVPLDVRLAIAGVQETVEVTADVTPFLQTAQVATRVRQELMSTLPSTRSVVAVAIRLRSH